MAAVFSVSLMRSDGLGRMLKETTTNTSLIFTNLDPGTLCTTKAYAWNVSGIPGNDFTYNQRSSPNAPADVQVAFNSDAVRAVVLWMPTEGALTYSVTASSGLLKLKCNTSSSSCTVPSLECSSEYYVSVIAYNDAGSSKPSDAASLKTIPCAPVDTSIEEDEPGHLLVSWSGVNFSHYYVVFVKSDDGLEVHCNTSHTQYHFQSDCGFTYFISIFAYNKAGQSPLGDAFNYTTAPCCPSDFRAILVSGNTVQVTGTPARGVEMYKTRAVDWDSVALCNDTDTATACALSALQCNTRYTTTVHSFSEAGAATRVHLTPCIPEIKNISKEALPVIGVHWQSNNEEATYIVTARGETGLGHCRSSGNFCTFIGLPCGSAFSVSAIARSPAGQSLPSYSVPLETAPCCPNEPDINSSDTVCNKYQLVCWDGWTDICNPLESPKGQAMCHTLQNYCLLGCITCSTNYTVSLKVISETGLTSCCTYQRIFQYVNCKCNWEERDSIYNLLGIVFLSYQ